MKEIRKTAAIGPISSLTHSLCSLLRSLSLSLSSSSACLSVTDAPLSPPPLTSTCLPCRPALSTQLRWRRLTSLSAHTSFTIATAGSPPSSLPSSAPHLPSSSSSYSSSCASSYTESSLAAALPRRMIPSPPATSTSTHISGGSPIPSCAAQLAPSPPPPCLAMAASGPSTKPPSPPTLLL